MKIALIVIGKTDAGYFVEAINEYKNRLVHYIPFEMEVIPDIKNVKNLSESQQKEREGDLILKALQPGDYLVLLDEKGKEFVNVVFMEETFWLTQVGMAELFDSSKSNVSEHLSHIFDEEELDKASCMRKFGISEFSHSFFFY